LALSLAGCGGSGGSDNTAIDDSDQPTELHDQLTSFNFSMDWGVDDFVAKMETVDLLNQALASDDGSPEKADEISALVDVFELDTSLFLIDVELLDLAEA
jgi:hypothetical protein